MASFSMARLVVSICTTLPRGVSEAKRTFPAYELTYAFPLLKAMYLQFSNGIEVIRFPFLALRTSILLEIFKIIYNLLPYILISLPTSPNSLVILGLISEKIFR